VLRKVEFVGRYTKPRFAIPIASTQMRLLLGESDCRLPLNEPDAGRDSDYQQAVPS
jgi:hypothetical protein